MQFNGNNNQVPASKPYRNLKLTQLNCRLIKCFRFLRTLLVYLYAL